MLVATLAKISLFTPAKTVSDKGLCPTFWAYFLTITLLNAANIYQSPNCSNFIHDFLPLSRVSPQIINSFKNTINEQDNIILEKIIYQKKKNSHEIVIATKCGKKNSVVLFASYAGKQINSIFYEELPYVYNVKQIPSINHNHFIEVFSKYSTVCQNIDRKSTRLNSS